MDSQKIKRQLLYDRSSVRLRKDIDSSVHLSDDIKQLESPQKRSRRSINTVNSTFTPRTAPRNDWYRMNEGFDGVDLQNLGQKRQRRKSGGQSGGKSGGGGSTKHTTPVAPPCEPPSQLFIHWDESDEESEQGQRSTRGQPEVTSQGQRSTRGQLEVTEQSPFYSAQETADSSDTPLPANQAAAQSTAGTTSRGKKAGKTMCRASSLIALHTQKVDPHGKKNKTPTPTQSSLASKQNRNSGRKGLKSDRSSSKKGLRHSAGAGMRFEAEFDRDLLQDQEKDTMLDIDVVSSQSQSEASEKSHDPVRCADQPMRRQLSVVMVTGEEQGPATQGSISQYESDSEKKPDPSQPTDTHKASVWACEVAGRLTSPDRPPQDRQDTEPPDSTKKKHKYLKEGLAERLQRLRQRERSAHTFWTHKVSHGKEQADISGVLCVEVLSHKKSFSVLQCACVCRSHHLNNHQPITVLLSDPALRCQVRAGCVVHIHPPWQKLRLECGEIVVLCTQFSHIPQQEAVTPSTDHTNSHSEEEVKWTQISTWQCACILDPSVKTAECPADNTECMHYQPITNANLSISDPQCLSAPAMDQTPGHNLEVVVRGGSPSNALRCDILGSIERREHAGMSCGFTATVQRVVQTRISPANIRKANTSSTPTFQTRLVVQDRKGIICEIQVPQNLTHSKDTSPAIESRQQTEGDWGGVTQGKVYRFTGLRVLQRTNRARSAGVFSLIDSIWRAEDCSQGTQSQDSDVQVPPQAPLFCYMLRAVEGESHCTEACVSSIPYRAPVMQTSPDLADGRCSFIGRLVYMKNTSTCDPVSVIYYVCRPDGSVVRVSHSATFHNQAQITPGEICKVLDALKANDKIVLDGYSDLQTKTEEEPLPDLPPTLPEVHLGSHIGNLVQLQGCVTGVDEGTAITWLACNVCGGDRLAGGTADNPFVFCNVCERSVTDPVTRMRLEVWVCVHGIEEPVKIQLQQSSIEKLLPAEDSADEGYEVGSVLGRAVGPLHAIVTNMDNHRDSHNMTFYTEEIGDTLLVDYHNVGPLADGGPLEICNAVQSHVIGILA